MTFCNDLKKNRFKNFACLFVLASLLSVAGFAADTTHVKLAFDKVVTDPSKGVNQYAQWAVFPPGSVSIRKATLYVTFSCPDSMRCADWDYSDRIILKTKGDVNAPASGYTLAHMLTPYGGAFDKNWSFKWKVDVTDFALWLRDSVELVYEHSGYEENKDRGWKILLDFSIIKGPAAAVPLAIHSVYNGNYQYGNPQKNMEELLKPYSFLPDSRATFAGLYVLQTGHGMDSSGCGEFCSKFREIWWNNELVSKQDIWKKCGDNPLFPQAGTWLTDRANWCPGYLDQPEVLNQKMVPGKENSFGVKMQSYETGDKNVNENIFATIVEYSSPVLKNDIALEDIKVPSIQQLFSRKNPASFNPLITIRNNGRSPLRSCTVDYGTIGYKVSNFKWEGNLAFNETADIILPGDIEFGEGVNKFFVEIKKPNGKADKYNDDNSLVSEFKGVDRHGNKIIIQVKTNNKPGDNGYAILNNAGKIIFERPAGSLQKDSLYSDTLMLDNGAYSFMLKDTAGDGLEFWYAVRAGRGTCKLLNGKGEMIKNFESDFGNFIKYDFIATADSAKWDKPEVLPAVGAFPTMSTGKVQVDYFSNTLQNPVVQIIADAPGKELVEEHTYFNTRKAIFNYDLSYRPAQRYYLKLFIDNKLVFTKRIRIVSKVPD